jgi:hypothetical protein
MSFAFVFRVHHRHVPHATCRRRGFGRDNLLACSGIRFGTESLMFLYSHGIPVYSVMYHSRDDVFHVETCARCIYGHVTLAFDR